MIDPQQLGDAVGLGSVPDNELVGVFHGVLSLSRWESGRRIEYFHPQEGHLLDVVYGKDGRIASLEPTRASTAELLETLRARAETSFGPEAGYEVRRDLLFSVPRIEGFWRHRDDWQIIPAPPTAHDSSADSAEHPFVLEYRVRPSENMVIGFLRWRRRLWELHLVLSLLLRGSITRESVESEHHWMVVPDSKTVRTAYLNEGYLVGGGFISRAADFTDPAELRPLDVVDDRVYYERREPRLRMDIPASLDTFFDRFEGAEAHVANNCCVPRTGSTRPPACDTGRNP